MRRLGARSHSEIQLHCFCEEVLNLGQRPRFSVRRQYGQEGVLRVVQRRDDVDIRAGVLRQAVVRDAEGVQEVDDMFERIGQMREECEGVGG